MDHNWIVSEVAERDALLRDCAERRFRISAATRVSGHDVDLEVYRAANLRDWASLLDLTSGSGAFLLELRTRWHHEGMLVSVSPDPGERSHQSAASGEADVIAASAGALPFEDECFDGVFLRRCELVDEAGRTPHTVDQLLAEMRRVVRPAGRAIVVAPSRTNLRHTIEFQRRLSLEIPELGVAQRARPALLAESATEILGPIFGPLESRVLNDYLHFRCIEVYLDYFDTTRCDYLQEPGEDLWREAMSRVRGWASAIFDTRRALAEPLSSTVFVATVL